MLSKANCIRRLGGVECAHTTAVRLFKVLGPCWIDDLEASEETKAALRREGFDELNVRSKDKEGSCDKESTADYGWSTLHYAAFNDTAEVVKVLLDAKCDKNAKDNCGATPVHVAIQHGYVDVVNLLLALP